jgi:hypothetical protein
VHLIWAGLILGIAAVWGVPIVASILKSVLPDSAQSYLPSAAIPGVSTQSVVTALVYGILLAGVLHVLRMVGLRGAKA